PRLFASKSSEPNWSRQVSLISKREACRVRCQGLKRCRVSAFTVSFQDSWAANPAERQHLWSKAWDTEQEKGKGLDGGWSLMTNGTRFNWYANLEMRETMFRERGSTNQFPGRFLQLRADL